MADPIFYTGDSKKALRAIITDATGLRLDISGATCRLFAEGASNTDRPTSVPGEPTWNGVLGVIVDGPNGTVDFLSIGALCALTDYDAQDYSYQIKIVYGGSPSLTSWTTKQKFQVQKNVYDLSI
jgi:hypothetical protein